MSFIFGNMYNDHNHPNKSLNLTTSVENNNNTKENVYSIQPTSLIQKLKILQCPKDPQHGPFDFICIAPNCPFDRLVCIDCFKDYPEKMKYMQMNGKEFVRIQKFIEDLANPELNAHDFEKIQKIKKTEAKLEKVLSLFDKQMLEEEKKIRQFYRDVELALIEVVRSSITQNMDSQLENYRLSSTKTREKVDKIVKSCRFLSNMDGSGKSGLSRNSHLQDLYYSVSAPQKNLKQILGHIEPLVMVMNNLSNYLSKFLKNLESLGNFPERVLKPKFDVITARGIYKDKELIIREELESCIEQMEEEFNQVSQNQNRTGNQTGNRYSQASMISQQPNNQYRGKRNPNNSQPQFNHPFQNPEFDNSVRDYFKDDYHDPRGNDIIDANDDFNQGTEFSRGLDISKIKVPHINHFYF